MATFDAFQSSADVSGLSGRYATALFALARQAGSLDAVAASLGTLEAAIAQSADARRLLTSPVVSRAAAGKAVKALADALALDGLTTRFLGVLAANRRLASLQAAARGYRALLARHKGEATAQVTAAHPLSEAQRAQLADKLKTKLKRDVAFDVTVDLALLGGLVVKVGSRQIDSSLKTKLDSIARALKA